MPDDDTMLGQNLVDVRNEGRRSSRSNPAIEQKVAQKRPKTADTLFTVPPKLTARQQLVYDLTEHGPLNALQAGVALHSARPQWCSCGPEGACEYADSNGREVLRALYNKGLLKRDRHHVYRRAGETAGLQGEEIPF